LSAPQVNAGWAARTRSMSMNSFFGMYSASDSTTSSGRNWGFPNDRQWLKITQVPRPANTWVFIDEHPDSINDGYFVNNSSVSNWQDIPGSYHDGGVNLSFVDSHAETHKWLSNTTKFPVRFSYPPVPQFD